MYIHFKFGGSEYVADVLKTGDYDFKVVLKDESLTKQFGANFHFHINRNRSVDFTPLNLSHSALYRLQGEIKNAIASDEDIFKTLKAKPQ